MDNRIVFIADKQFRPNENIQAYYHDQVYALPHKLIPVHSHNFYELNIVINGTGRHLFNGKEYNILSGDMFMIPPKIEHGYVFESENYSIFHILFNNQFFEQYEKVLEKINGYNIMFDIDPLLRLQNAECFHNFLHIDLAQNSMLAGMMKDLTILHHANTPNIELKKELLALFIVTQLCEMLGNFKTPSLHNNAQSLSIMKSMEYIQKNFSSKINLNELSKVACMSRSSYIRHFKKIVNLSPLEYLHLYRIQQAKTMLRENDNSIATIAQNCGFCDSAHFIRMFKLYEKKSPLAYRKHFDN